MTPHQLLTSILRTEFWAFFRASFEFLEPGGSLVQNWHLEVICDALSKCEEGHSTRLLMALPPRSLKSLITSVIFPVWALGRNQNLQIIAVSYSEPLATTFGRMRRKLIESGLFRDTFPETAAAMVRVTDTEIETVTGGSIFTTSVGGTLTGRGADMMIIDDPLKAEAAASEKERSFVNRWYRGTAYSRLNHKTESVMIIVAQRTHADDLIGHVAEHDEWDELVLPAIAPEDLEFAYGSKTFVWHEGSTLNPAYESLESLAKTSRTLGSVAFQSQYLQDPQPAGGMVVKREWFQVYDPAAVRQMTFDEIVMSIDPAISGSAASDYTACTVWGALNNHYYLLHVWRGRLPYPDLLRQIQSLADVHAPTIILIEAAGGGQQIVQSLSAETALPVVPVKPEGDKESRLIGVSALIEGGRVLVPPDAPWLADYLAELCSFPNAKFDDQVDSTSQALDRLRQPKNRLPEFRLVSIQSSWIKHQDEPRRLFKYLP
ncbi:phage terminase large subunit [uncultured Enterovirga sp.]|uniref:phage terminase large subunit n=1 Tax=uncultured Enterovirga sp. TaxID=2026352 RepID=UPI0035CA84B7